MMGHSHERLLYIPCRVVSRQPLCGIVCCWFEIGQLNRPKGQAETLLVSLNHDAAQPVPVIRFGVVAAAVSAAALRPRESCPA